MRNHVVTLVLLSACTADSDLSQIESNSVVANGQNLNGQNLNGQNLNGQNLNGQNLNGPDNGSFTIWTSLLGVKLNGKQFNASLASTVFTGNDGSTTVTGTGFAQAEFQGMRGDGRTVRMRIRSVVAPPAGSTTWRYFVEYREDNQSWYPVCANASGPIAAIPVNGIWDHRQGVAGGGGHVASSDKFTFACEGQGAIGKCIAMGYEPWSAQGGVSLAGHHRSCIRMLRGDYCGDGTSYTQDGNRVNVYDGLGIQDDTEDWVIEAEWDVQGARCFYPLNRSRAGIPCYDARVALACGSPTNFGAGALLMNETPTAGLTP
ncbi:MAG: ADYC domain-containing protein [Myxococcota bacterium]|nr:ADYC domain-containing protein [Myxococcota bacterium]